LDTDQLLHCCIACDVLSFDDAYDLMILLMMQQLMV